MLACGDFEERLLITTDKGFVEHAKKRLTAAWSFVFGSRMSNAFTPEPWPGFGSSRRENGQACFSLFEIKSFAPPLLYSALWCVAVSIRVNQARNHQSRQHDNHSLVV